jgi:probable addiction module antidote protein
MENKNLELADYEDVKIEMLKNRPGLARLCLESEIGEYMKTGDPTYLRMELKTAIKAFGYCNFEKKVGLSRKAIYNIVNGKTEPKLKSLLKFIDALGYSLNCNLTEKMQMNS